VKIERERERERERQTELIKLSPTENSFEVRTEEDERKHFEGDQLQRR